MIRRREFITLLGATAAWPLAATAQQGDRVRRIGVLMVGDENDPVAKTYLSAFTQALADLGWADGRNVRIDLRWPGGDINRIRALAQELVDLQPDIILTTSTPATAALQRKTRTIPIVFVSVADPVASGFIAGLNRPGGNITGFGLLEGSLVGKQLELLSEIAPGLKRAAIMFNPDTAPASVYMPSFETAARPRSDRHLSSRRPLCRSHSTRREAGRSPGAVSDQVRDGPEPQDRQGARPYGAAIDFASR
jgi:putative tryptophan/tyrosine transport system substrate-binding protein